jgi:hypothetical protein
MRLGPQLVLLILGLLGLSLATIPQASAQGAALTFQKTVVAGSPFSIQSTGTGKGTLYIVGFGQVLKRDVQLGQPVSFSADSLRDAGHYLVILTQASGLETDSLDVTPASAPADLSFLAKPSRLPVSLHDGITGAAYVFDAYGNLIVAPMPMSFVLSSPSGTVQKVDAQTHDGAAWAELDSSGHQGIDKFMAQTGGISSTRVIRQFPGDPCGLKMSAHPSGQQIQLQTDPVVDCSGNPVLDGTIVTFTEAYDGGQSTVDVPLKHGIAEITMPAHPGATLSVASGVVMGNQIRWEQ